MIADEKHELHDFMQQITTEMASEYRRIFARSKEDPGTAGDQGEENWATLLRDWLPPNYQIVTKGRVLGHDGSTSPQIDILVLKPFYPKKLLDKKLYLSSGVAAIFECKNTLKGEHIRSGFARSPKFKSVCAPRNGTPYCELVSPIVFGLLAHSHGWKSPNSDPLGMIKGCLDKELSTWQHHPRELIDLICVADVGSWSLTALSVYEAKWNPDNFQFLVSIFGAEYGPASSFMCHNKDAENQSEHFTPIGAFVSELIKRLAWEDATIRDYADYFRQANISGQSSGVLKFWPLSTYSDEVRSGLESGKITDGRFWDAWSVALV